MADHSDQLFRHLIALEAFMSEKRKDHFSLRRLDVTGDRADCRSLATDLGEALGSWSVLDRATGMLMARLGYDAFEAFDLLDIVSRDSNQTVRVVAQGLVDAETRARQVCSSAH
ncbi:MAG: hypothetical protein QOI99_1637 [Actinomycetota bacterium]|jgi:hypothetical protein|nr:hypothetical protein [Actinomycetota bacterium]